MGAAGGESHPLDPLAASERSQPSLPPAREETLARGLPLGPRGVPDACFLKARPSGQHGLWEVLAHTPVWLLFPGPPVTSQDLTWVTAPTGP